MRGLGRRSVTWTFFQYLIQICLEIKSPVLETNFALKDTFLANALMHFTTQSSYFLKIKYVFTSHREGWGIGKVPKKSVTSEWPLSPYAGNEISKLAVLEWPLQSTEVGRVEFSFVDFLIMRSLTNLKVLKEQVEKSLENPCSLTCRGWQIRH